MTTLQGAVDKLVNVKDPRQFIADKGIKNKPPRKGRDRTCDCPVAQYLELETGKLVYCSFTHAQVVNSDESAYLPENISLLIVEYDRENKLAEDARKAAKRKRQESESGSSF